MKAIDLFAGSGAVSQGLKNAGFDVVAAVDNDKIACSTYRLNHPETELFEKNIRTLTQENVYAKIGSNPNISLLVVCAPCQPFSNQNRRKTDTDPRKDLILESLKFVDWFSPNIVLFENVPGIARSKIIHILSNELDELGYELLGPEKVDASTLGVPQRRIRSVSVAMKRQFSNKSFFKNLAHSAPVSVQETIGRLPSLKSGEKDQNDPLHFARNHNKLALERLKHIPKNGGSRKSLPDNLVLNCHKNSNSFPDVYGRLSWDDVAPTLTTGCTDITKGRFAHPEDDRAISLREAALLQTFPLDYKFSGNSGQIAKQIGNAVPVVMAEQLALAAKKLLTQK